MVVKKLYENPKKKKTNLTILWALKIIYINYIEKKI